MKGTIMLWARSGNDDFHAVKFALPDSDDVEAVHL